MVDDKVNIEAEISRDVGEVLTRLGLSLEDGTQKP